jgi:hypothetical protein
VAFTITGFFSDEDEEEDQDKITPTLPNNFTGAKQDGITT